MRIDHLVEQSGVYRITNAANGKVYVGSALNILARARAHLSTLNSGKHPNEHLQNAWRRYGCDFFSFEVVEIVGAPRLLREREQLHLELTQACDRDRGYNISPTALALTHTEETRRKISEANRRRVVSDETKARIRAAALARSPELIGRMTQALRNKSPEHMKKLAVHHRGKTISQEQRRKQSETTKGRKQSPEHIAARTAPRIGKKLSPAHCAAIKAAKQNVSEETRRRMSEARKRYYAEKM